MTLAQRFFNVGVSAGMFTNCGQTGRDLAACKTVAAFSFGTISSGFICTRLSVGGIIIKYKA